MELRELLEMVPDMQRMEIVEQGEDMNDTIMGMQYALSRLLNPGILACEVLSVRCNGDKMKVVVEAEE